MLTEQAELDIKNVYNIFSKSVVNETVGNKNRRKTAKPKVDRFGNLTVGHMNRKTKRYTNKGGVQKHLKSVNNYMNDHQQSKNKTYDNHSVATNNSVNRVVKRLLTSAKHNWSVDVHHTEVESDGMPFLIRFKQILRYFRYE